MPQASMPLYPMLAQCLYIEAAESDVIAAAAARLMAELNDRDCADVAPPQRCEACAVEGAGALVALGRWIDPSH